jgi:hypothetical protein
LKEKIFIILPKVINVLPKNTTLSVVIAAKVAADIVRMDMIRRQGI